MEFNYDDPKPDPRKPRAYIDEDGDLVFIADENIVDPAAVCVSDDRCVIPYDAEELEDDMKTARRVFYEGDQITITF